MFFVSILFSIVYIIQQHKQIMRRQTYTAPPCRIPSRFFPFSPSFVMIPFEYVFNMSRHDLLREMFLFRASANRHKNPSRESYVHGVVMPLLRIHLFPITINNNCVWWLGTNGMDFLLLWFPCLIDLHSQSSHVLKMLTVWDIWNWVYFIFTIITNASTP